MCAILHLEREGEKNGDEKKKRGENKWFFID
jgi:hypothetical protein